jgi:hypothetical protein
MSSSPPPLTHHDILALMPVFTTNGRQLDLPASDRVARRLIFKPRVLPASGGADLGDSLQLDNPHKGSFHLARRIEHPSGMVARLQISGKEPGPLLAALEAVDATPLFRAGAGYLIGYSYRLDPDPAGAPPRQHLVTPAALAVQHLVTAQAEVCGLKLQLSMPAVKSYPATLEISAHPGLDLPDDLLAVLGRDWSTLSQHSKGWRAHLRIHGKGQQAEARAAAQWEAAVQHVALTLTQAPAEFHSRLTAARWRVASRRALPLLSLVGLVLAALAVPFLGIARGSIYWMLIFNAPPLLLVLGFSLREIPRFELPRPPRRLSAANWWPVAAGSAAGSSPPASAGNNKA